MHPNEESKLRSALRLAQGSPLPECAEQVVQQFRHLANPLGTGTLSNDLIVVIAVKIQEEEAKHGRTPPALPSEKAAAVPQHMRKPTTGDVPVELPPMQEQAKVKASKQKEPAGV